MESAAAVAQRTLVSGFCRSLRTGQKVTSEWAILMPGEDPQSANIEWSTWHGTVDAEDPLAITWSKQLSTGAEVDESENPQRFPPTVNDPDETGALIWYKALKATREPQRPSISQKRSNADPTSNPQPQARTEHAARTEPPRQDTRTLAEDLADAHRGMATKSLAEGLRVPIESVGAMQVWSPDRWFGRGAAWRAEFDTWRNRLALASSNTDHALTVHRRAQLAASVLTTIQRDARHTKDDLEPVYFCFVDLALAYCEAHLSSGSGPTLRTKFSTQWAEGRVNLPALVQAALATPRPQEPPATTPAATAVPAQTTRPDPNQNANPNTRGRRGGGRGGGHN